jgi:hypothetical protein
VMVSKAKASGGASGGTDGGMGGGTGGGAVAAPKQDGEGEAS